MKGQLMSKEEMVQLIRQVWSDAMSDNGSIWRKSNEALRKAKRDYPELYTEAMPQARELGML
jgi:ribosomal protein L18E